MHLRLRYVYEDTDRHGTVRRYFWRGKGHAKVRLTDEPGTEAFARAYAALLRSGPVAVASQRGPAPQSLAWLCNQYCASPEFRDLGASTQRVRRRVIERMMAEPVSPGAVAMFGAFPLDRLTTKALRVLRDRKAHVTAAANDRVKALHQLFRWALEEEIIDANPARDLKRFKRVSKGHHTWTMEEVEAFEARHPIGSKARLALAIMRWTGLRRSDAVLFGRQHVRDGSARITPHKNHRRAPRVLEFPVLPELQAVLDASPTGHLTYLVTEFAKPFSAAGFGNWFRDRCNEAGLPHCTAHGLRKAGATTAANNGASAHTLMAIFGWRSLADAQLYTEKVDRKRLAAAGMGLLVDKK